MGCAGDWTIYNFYGVMEIEYDDGVLEMVWCFEDENLKIGDEKLERDRDKIEMKISYVKVIHSWFEELLWLDWLMSEKWPHH